MKDIPPIIAEAALMRLRVDLYGAAQLLKGEQLDQLKELVREIYLVLELDLDKATAS